jgi:MraZ protein
LFSGAHVNGLDAKNRLSVPAPVREVIENRSAARAVVLVPDEHRPCLKGFDLSYLDSLQADLDRRFEGDWTPAKADTARATFAMAETLKIDDNGRVILSPILRELGELAEAECAAFLGGGAYFELWNPAVYLEQPGQDPRLHRMVRALLAARG